MAAGADAVVFDLEDSVEAAQKQPAREAIAEFLATPAVEGSRIVRFNAVNTADGERDIAFFTGKRGFDGVLIPKVEDAAAIERVATALGDVPAPTPVLPLIETPLGVLRAAEIAAAKATVPALLFGAEDLTARLGAPRTVDGDELLFARGQLAMAAAAVNADAIDAVYANVKDLASLRRDAERARGFGFRGKMAIPPAQVPIINEVFTPAPEEIAKAEAIVQAFADNPGSGVVGIGGVMYDRPHLTRAERLLTRVKP